MITDYFEPTPVVETEDDYGEEVVKIEKGLEYIAFMCAVHHINFQYLEDTLKEYDIGLYLISAETTNDAHKETQGQHFHFLVQMTDKDYHSFSKRVFKDKFKLRGQAKDGKPRQYGRVKKIEDLERMGAYTIKQGNIRTNMTEKQLEAYKKITFVAKEQLNFEEELYTFLVNNAYDKDLCRKLVEYNKLAVLVINFVRNHKVKHSLTRQKIDKYVRFYQLHYLKEEMTDEQLWVSMS